MVRRQQVKTSLSTIYDFLMAFDETGISTLTQIYKKTSISMPTVQYVIKILEKENLLTREFKGRCKEIKLSSKLLECKDYLIVIHSKIGKVLISNEL